MSHPHDDNVHGLHDAGPYFPAPMSQILSPCFNNSLVFFFVFTLKFEFAIKNRGGGGGMPQGMQYLQGNIIIYKIFMSKLIL
jgi:hypothetical protein